MLLRRPPHPTSLTLGHLLLKEKALRPAYNESYRPPVGGTPAALRLQIGIYRADARNAKCRVQNAELGLRRGKTTHAFIPTKRSAWRDPLFYITEERILRRASLAQDDTKFCEFCEGRPLVCELEFLAPLAQIEN